MNCTLADSGNCAMCRTDPAASATSMVCIPGWRAFKSATNSLSALPMSICPQAMSNARPSSDKLRVMRTHLLEGQARGDEHAAQVDRHHLIEVFDTHFIRAGRRAENPGVVEKHVQMPDFAYELIEHRSHGLGVTYIGGQRDGPCLPRRNLAQAFGTARHQAHGPAFRQEQLRRGAANP